MPRSALPELPDVHHVGAALLARALDLDIAAECLVRIVGHVPAQLRDDKLLQVAQERVPSAAAAAAGSSRRGAAGPALLARALVLGYARVERDLAPRAEVGHCLPHLLYVAAAAGRERGGEGAEGEKRRSGVGAAGRQKSALPVSGRRQARCGSLAARAGAAEAHQAQGRGRGGERLHARAQHAALPAEAWRRRAHSERVWSVLQSASSTSGVRGATTDEGVLETPAARSCGSEYHCCRWPRS